MTASRPQGNDRRELLRAMFGLGLILPLLAGGNLLFLLEPEDGLRYFLLAAVAVCLILLYGSRGRLSPARSRPSRSAAAAISFLLILAICWIGNLALRPSGPRAAIEAQGVLCAILLYGVLSWRPPSSGAWASLFGGLLAGALLTAAYAQYQYWVAFPRLARILRAAGQEPIYLVNANFYNANCYAAFLAAVILTSTALTVEFRERTARWPKILGIVALLVTLLLTGSRSSIALLAAVAMGIITVWQRSLLQSRGSFPAVISVVAAALLGGAVAAGTVDLAELWRVGWLGRVAIWRGSLALIREHWLLGVGLGRFWDYFDQYRITTYYTRYPHSLILEVLAELGVVGGVALAGFLVAAFAGPLGKLGPSIRHRSLAPLLLILAAGLLTAHAMLDIDWHAPANPILLFLLLAAARNLESREC